MTSTDARSQIARLVDRRLAVARQLAREDPTLLDNPEMHFHVGEEIAEQCRGDYAEALRELVRQHLKLDDKLNQVVAALKEMKAHCERQPRLVRVVSGPIPFGRNGESRTLFHVTPLGRENAGSSCVCVLDGVQPPNLLDVGYADAELQFYLGPANQITLRRLEQHEAVSASLHPELPGVGEVVVDDGSERHVVLYAKEALMHEVERLLADGELVRVRHDQLTVESIVESQQRDRSEDWLEFPDVEGPRLDELVFPARLARQWRKDVRKMVRGAGFRVELVGPTGVGKTDAVLRAGREAARQSGKPLAIVRISASHVGSHWYSGTERAILRAFKRAQKLVGAGYIVIILLDEADALLGNSEGRYEGSVDRRVRNTLQELLSGDLAGVAVYATRNPHSDSWLPAAIERRFTSRKYPRTRRSQMAKIIGSHASPKALNLLQLDPNEFGERVADYLYSDQFIVAWVHLHSGRKTPVRARDLHNCSPGKVLDLIHAFCGDLEDEDEPEANSLQALWEAVDREFLAHTLNAANLYEHTFLSPPSHDSVKRVESTAEAVSAAPQPWSD